MSNAQSAATPILPAVILGIGLSGFFDGILLHQVLQWHHLLSLVPGEPFRDMGTQILADGLFHLLMYIITAAGLWLLWRRRSAFVSAANSWRAVAGGGLLGFGIWNVVDVAFFHWVLGIHRIRVNVPDSMHYDLGWLAALGLIPLILAWKVLRGTKLSGDGHGRAAAVILALLSLGAGGLAARPQPNSRTALAFFAPGTSIGQLFSNARAARTSVLWVDPHGRMMAVALDDAATLERLYRAGALFVTRSPALAGCAAAART